MPPTPLSSSSFTLAANGGLLRVLQTKCSISAGFDPALPSGGASPQQAHEFVAIWDTGATGSVITRRVVQACDLAPTGMVKTHGVQGEHISPTYLVNVSLPNGVQFPFIRVTEGILPGGADGDVLIGMDIITAGDFALTNKGGRTVFSFRVPSMICTDFVKEHNAAADAAQLRAVQQAHARRKPPKVKKQFGRNKK